MTDKELKLKQIQLLDDLIDNISISFKTISDMEHKCTEAMKTTDEKNLHYKNNTENYHNTLMECTYKIANLNYELKKELGILNNK